MARDASEMEGTEYEIDPRLILYRYTCSECGLTEFYDRPDSAGIDYMRDLPCPHGCKREGKQFYIGATMHYRDAIDITGPLLRVIARQPDREAE